MQPRMSRQRTLRDRIMELWLQLADETSRRMYAERIYREVRGLPLVLN